MAINFDNVFPYNKIQEVTVDGQKNDKVPKNLREIRLRSRGEPVCRQENLDDFRISTGGLSCTSGFYAQGKRAGVFLARSL